VQAISKAKGAGRSSVWLTLSGHQTHLLPEALSAGFRIHSGGGEEVECYKWVGSSEDKVPPYATATVAVAGVTTDADGRLLVVKDRGKRSSWKFPGGYVDVGEDLGAAAAREVREETGVVAEAASVLGVRVVEGRGRRGDVKDLYVLVHMRASTTAIEVEHVEEIEEAKWVDLPTFAAESEHPLNRYGAYLAMQALEAQAAGGDGVGLSLDRVGTLADPAEKVAFLRPCEAKPVP